MSKDKPKSKEILIENESYSPAKKRGNGLLKRQVWQNEKGQITRYSLTYINPNIFAGDNGRVLGYDNAHNFHHKHYLGNITPIEFTSFSDIEERFQREYEAIHENAKNI